MIAFVSRDAISLLKIAGKKKTEPGTVSLSLHTVNRTVEANLKITDSNHPWCLLKRVDQA